MKKYIITEESKREAINILYEKWTDYPIRHILEIVIDALCVPESELQGWNEINNKWHKWGYSLYVQDTSFNGLWTLVYLGEVIKVTREISPHDIVSAKAWADKIIASREIK